MGSTAAHAADELSPRRTLPTTHLLIASDPVIARRRTVESLTPSIVLAFALASVPIGRGSSSVCAGHCPPTCPMHAVAKCHHPQEAGGRTHHQCHTETGAGIVRAGCTHTQQTLASEVIRSVIPATLTVWPPSRVTIFIPTPSARAQSRRPDPPEPPPPIFSLV